MSELDYELASMPSPDVIELFESEENEINKSSTCEALFSEPSKIASPEIIDLCQSDESDIERLDTNEGVRVKVDLKSNETYSDLEEGEIKEPVDECNNNDSSICKYFRKGICYLGKNCRFLHIGVGSYKMFESNITNTSSLDGKPLPVYNPVELGHFTQEFPDSWDIGLEEAKRLVLRAKLKKETDLDFEEKQLYQGLDDDKIIESVHKINVDLSDKHTKWKGTPLRKNSGLRGKLQKAIPCSRTPKKTKSRTRNVSDFFSSHHNRSFSPNSASTSTCSDCAASYCSDKSANHYRKTKSKLERAFSKALHTPETSRYRKKLPSRRTFPSYPRKRSLSRSSFIKRFIYRSYSKSPSPSRRVNSEKQLERGFVYKPLHKQPTSLPDARRKQPSLNSEKVRDSSPFSKLLSKNNPNWLESYSSDMTVSSLKCTSVSCASSEENKSSKLLKLSGIGSRRVSSDKGINENCKKKGESSYDFNKWLDSVSKSAKETEESNSKRVKTDDKTTESLKPPEKDIVNPKRNRKQSSWSTSEDELSADEQELLKYIPSKNQKLEQRENKFSNNTEETKPTAKPSLLNIPQKVVSDFGSVTESTQTKFVHDCGPNEESFKSSKADNGQNMDDHDTNGENNSIKESIKTTLLQKSKSTALENCQPTEIEILDDVQETLSKQSGQEELKQNDFSTLNSSKRRRSSSESSSAERQYSAGELELLKYVSMRNPTVSKVIKKQRQGNRPPSATKKTPPTKKSNSVGSKISCHKSAGQEKARNTKMSRREQLMKQLEAVESAIARKKELLKLELMRER